MVMAEDAARIAFFAFKLARPLEIPDTRRWPRPAQVPNRLRLPFARRPDRSRTAEERDRLLRNLADRRLLAVLAQATAAAELCRGRQ
jgi:hypothetical protein